MSEQSWRWITVPIDGNPDNCRNVLVEGPGLLPGPRVVLECGNIDAEDRDKIGAVPELIGACLEFNHAMPEIQVPQQQLIKAWNRVSRALDKAIGETVCGEGVPDA